MTTGLRERKKLATRFALHQAALQLVSEHGLDGVSVDDIAARAEVSPRTFFNYFPSKDDAVIGFDTTRASDLAERFTARPSGETALAALRAVQVEQATELSAEPEGLWPLRLRVMAAEPVLIARLHGVLGASERALAEAIAVRTGADADADVLPSLLAGVTGVALRTALHRWLSTDFTRSLPDLVGEAWDVLAGGLSDAAPREF